MAKGLRVQTWTVPTSCSSIGSSLEFQGGCGSSGPAFLGGRRVCMGTRWVDISCNSFVRTAGATPLPSVEKAVVCLASLHQTRSLGKSRVPAPARIRSHFDRRILVVDRDKETKGSGAVYEQSRTVPNRLDIPCLEKQITPGRVL
jgi:hypothetical protein